MTKKQIFRLNEIIGGLYVGQWKGKKSKMNIEKQSILYFIIFLN